MPKKKLESRTSHKLSEPRKEPNFVVEMPKQLEGPIKEKDFTDVTGPVEFRLSIKEDLTERIAGNKPEHDSIEVLGLYAAHDVIEHLLSSSKNKDSFLQILAKQRTYDSLIGLNKSNVRLLGHAASSLNDGTLYESILKYVTIGLGSRVYDLEQNNADLAYSERFRKNLCKAKRAFIKQYVETEVVPSIIEGSLSLEDAIYLFPQVVSPFKLDKFMTFRTHALDAEKLTPYLAAYHKSEDPDIFSALGLKFWVNRFTFDWKNMKHYDPTMSDN